MSFRKLFAQERFFLLACPALLWQIFFLYVPLFLLICYSFMGDWATFRAFTVTLQNYIDLSKLIYLKVILQTFVLACCAVVCCLVLAYPVAYCLAMKVSKRWRTLVLFSLIIPSWMSLIVQVYAWFFLLEKNGVFMKALVWLGLMRPDTYLLNNYFSLLIGVVSIYIPFMIIPIYTVLERMDRRLLEASADLGANRFQTFWRVVFPFSLPGVYTGCLLVFVPTLGEYAVPSLLGGSKMEFWGTVIAQKFLVSRDIKTGSAFVVLGAIVFAMLLFGMYFVFRISRALYKRLQG